MVLMVWCGSEFHRVAVDLQEKKGAALDHDAEAERVLQALAGGEECRCLRAARICPTCQKFDGCWRGEGILAGCFTGLVIEGHMKGCEVWGKPR